VKVRASGFVAHEGYFTAPHAMGVLRAGTVTSRLLSQPERLGAGAEWVFERGGRAVVHRIVEARADGLLRIETPDGSGETVLARAIDGQLEVSEVSIEGLVVRFDRGHFSLTMDGAGDLVGGRVAMAQSPTGSVIILRPNRPAWAASRAVRVACTRDGDTMRAVTTIGDSAL
jgi:hypothetical protein